MATEQVTRSVASGQSSHPSTKQDPKSSLNYCAKSIFNKPARLYGREGETQILQSSFHRLVHRSNDIDGADKLDDSSGTEKRNVKDGANNPTETSDHSSLTSTDDASENPSDIIVHSVSLADASCQKRDANGSNPIRYCVTSASDISIKYESTLVCNAPRKREAVFLYGPQGVGKRSLVQYALEGLVKEKGGWFLRGDFERDYFGSGGPRSRRRSSGIEGKAQRGVRFEDEQSNDDDGVDSATSIPLSGIRGVCEEICVKLLDLSKDESAAEAKSSVGSKRGLVRFIMSHLFDETKEKLLQSLSLKERQLLVRSVGLPNLKTILGEDSDQQLTNGHDIKIEDVLHHKKKFHYAFQKFLTVICQIHGPLVICFNNFQLADDASLDLLQSVLFDREIGGLMIAGCIQSRPSSDFQTSANEIVHISERIGKKFHALINHWKNDGVVFGLTVSDIEVGTLTLDSTKEFLTDMLCTEQNINPLAEVCHEYSHGNAYFLLRFMEILHKKKLLHKSGQDFQWSWDSDISSNFSSSNISEIILRESVNKLSKEARSLLLLATCIGSTFIDENLLFTVWSKFERKSRLNADDQAKFRLLINESIYRKIIARVQLPSVKGRRAYHWTHESMITSISAHVAPHDVASLRYEIGSTLEYCFPEKADVFVVANLVNSGGNSLLGSLDKKKRVKWAEKNLMAARKAVEMSAFSSAAQYAEEGIEYLPSNRRWKDHCKLMLELSSISAEVAGALGKSRIMERWCEEIVCRNELTTYDKLRAYMTLIVNTASKDAPKAVSLCLGVLRKLDCTFSKEVVARDTESFLSRIEETRVLKKEEFVSEIEGLPRMDDREKIECVKLLCRLCQFYIRQSKPAFIMAISRAARWTLHYGLTAESPIMFAYLGLAYTIKEEFRVGSMNGEAALALLTQTNNQIIKAKTHFIVWYMVMPWVRHVRDSTRPLLAGYNFGLQSGDVACAMACIFGKLVIDLISGRSLRLIELTCRAFVPQMEDARVEDVALGTRILWQTVLHLIGNDIKDSTLLVGEAFNETEFTQNPNAPPHIKNYLDALKSYLFLFTGQHTKGAELALERENKFIESVPGSALGLVDLVSRGIPLIEMSKATKKRNYTKALNDVRARSKAWSNKGVCSMIHLELLLEAEQAALDGKLDDAADFYKKGMSFASRSGFVQDVALINDRYASFLVARNMSEKEAEYHTEKAMTSYERWGAMPRKMCNKAQCESGPSTLIKRFHPRIPSLRRSI
eukprot:CCRYP_010950-RA/>CCRYP_010950-RA protein AED:0.24 eAED:0.24 QI:0/0.8/0.66/1/0.8/0.66/6/1906/1244